MEVALIVKDRQTVRWREGEAKKETYTQTDPQRDTLTERNWGGRLEGRE